MPRKHECEAVKPEVTSEMIEAEITPEMVRAGAKALCAMDRRVETEDDIVVEIFVAMALAKANSDEKG